MNWAGTMLVFLPLLLLGERRAVVAIERPPAFCKVTGLPVRRKDQQHGAIGRSPG